MSDLDRASVREWLRRMHPTDEAGITGNFESCPLANYLKERYDTQEAEVEGDRYMLLGAYHTLPDWAREYIDRVDHYASDDTGEPFDEVVISAGAALELLDRAPSGEEG